MQNLGKFLVVVLQVEAFKFGNIHFDLPKFQQMWPSASQLSQNPATAGNFEQSRIQDEEHTGSDMAEFIKNSDTNEQASSNFDEKYATYTLDDFLEDSITSDELTQVELDSELDLLGNDLAPRKLNFLEANMVTRTFQSMRSMVYAIAVHKGKTSLPLRSFWKRMANYGCHCWPESTDQDLDTTFGTPVDPLDKTCFRLKQCHKCVKMNSKQNDNGSIYQPHLEKYSFAVNRISGEIACMNQPDSNQYQHCMCDREFAFEYTEAYPGDADFNVDFWSGNPEGRLNQKNKNNLKNNQAKRQTVDEILAYQNQQEIDPNQEEMYQGTTPGPEVDQKFDFATFCVARRRTALDLAPDQCCGDLGKQRPFVSTFQSCCSQKVVNANSC